MRPMILVSRTHKHHDTQYTSNRKICTMSFRRYKIQARPGFVAVGVAEHPAALLLYHIDSTTDIKILNAFSNAT